MATDTLDSDSVLAKDDAFKRRMDDMVPVVVESLKRLNPYYS